MNPIFVRSLGLVFVLALTTLARPSRAAGGPSALDELKDGYALKKSGHCRDAIPHFLASYRLDRKPKALLNLADCEAQTGDLLAARDHAAEGGDLARQQNDAELAAVAQTQLASLAQKTPRLTLRLAASVPSGTEVTMDGVPVVAATLGTPLALNPGVHRVTAAAPGRADREIDIALGEGARQEIEVQAGTSLPVAMSIPTSSEGGPAPESGAEGKVERVTTGSGLSGERRALTYGVLGLGVAGIAVGIGVGLAADSKHDPLAQNCQGGHCAPSEQGALDAFHALRTWSTIGYAVGAAALVGGAVLWLTTPKSVTGASARLVIGPASAGVWGTF